jgi:ribosomal subunit interface protein
MVTDCEAIDTIFHYRMNIDIKATNIELTDAIRSYVNDKIGSVEKFVGTDAKNIQCHVEVEKTSAHHQKGDVYRAEVNMTASGVFQRAEFTSDNLYAAIDTVRDELVSTTKSAQDKAETLERKGSREIKEGLQSLE